MPLVRVTPENAVETVHAQVEDFRETIAAAGRTPAFEKLADQADELAAVIATGRLEVELLALDDLHPEWTGALAHWLGVEPAALAAALTGEAPWSPPPPASGAALVEVRTGRHPGGRRAGARVPPVLVVAHGSRESPPREIVEEVVAEMRRRPLTLLAAPEGSDWARALAGLGSRETWMARFVELGKVAGLSLGDNFERPPWNAAAPLACAWSVTSALASLQTAFSVLLEKEDRAVGAKKAALEQRSSRQGSFANPNEVVGEVRTYLQKRFEAFQKTVSAELADLTAPHDGTLTREIGAGVEAFSTFDKEKKPKFDLVTIPKEVEEGLLGRVRETLASTLRSQWVRLREVLRDAEAEVEDILDRKEAPPVALHFDHLPEQRVETIVQRGVHLQKGYKGEITRRGPMDYFMAARRYQMLFFMIFSAFGLSFIRSYREFTIPAGVLLLAFGMLQVVNGARKQRAEAEEKELGKARDSLRGDLTRAMAEVQKNWEQAVSGHLARQQAEALEAVETTVKSVADQVSREAAESKDLLQQQMRGLDGSQRKLQEGVRKSEAAAKDLETLSGQLMEFYAGQVKPQEGGGAGATSGAAGGAGGRPGAGGAAGAAGGAAAAAAAAAKAAQERLASLGVGGGGGGAKAPVAGAGRAGSAGGGAGRAGGGTGSPGGGGAADLAAQLKQKAAERMKKLEVGGGKAAGAGGGPGAARGPGTGASRSGGSQSGSARPASSRSGGSRPGSDQSGGSSSGGSASGSRPTGSGAGTRPSGDSRSGGSRPGSAAGRTGGEASGKASSAAEAARERFAGLGRKQEGAPGGGAGSGSSGAGRRGDAGKGRDAGSGDTGNAGPAKAGPAKASDDESPAALAQRLKKEAEERLKKLQGGGGSGSGGGSGKRS